MSVRKAQAEDLLRYIQSGLNDATCSEKFGNSYQELQRMVKDLMDAGMIEPIDAAFFAPEKRRISARQIVADIRGGMSREDLMHKYRLAPRMLQSVLRKLVSARYLKTSELSDNFQFQLWAREPDKVRDEARFCLDFELPIFDRDDPSIAGRIVDLATRGVGVVGIPCQVHERRTFEVFHEEFFQIDRFSFEAECRWTRKKRGAGEVISGFRITRIRNRDLGELHKLIQLLAL